MEWAKEHNFNKYFSYPVVSQNSSSVLNICKIVKPSIVCSSSFFSTPHPWIIVVFEISQMSSCSGPSFSQVYLPLYEEVLQVLGSRIPVNK